MTGWPSWVVSSDSSRTSAKRTSTVSVTALATLACTCAENGSSLADTT